MFRKKFLNLTRKSFRNFDDIYNFAKKHTTEEFLGLCVSEVYFKKEKREKVSYELKDITEYAKNLFTGCFISPFVGGATVQDFITDFKQNIEEYRWLNAHLADQASIDTYFHILRYRLFLNNEDLNDVAYLSMQYFIPALLPKKEPAVYVDCGTYDGQTVKDFIEVYGTYDKIYAYEPSVDNYHNCCKVLENLPGVAVRNKGLSDENGTMRFTSHMPAAGNRLNPDGDILVDITTLDNDIEEKTTFIKMDIEGAEQGALSGARRHIAEDSPALAVCLYHTLEDLWKIPRIIDSINSGYQFYMRYHATENLIPEEIVLYAKPVGDGRN